MASSVSGKQKILSFFPHLDLQCDIQPLWSMCPNQMLWEAIRSSEAQVLSKCAVLQQLQQAASVFVFPEPLPALYIGAEPAYAIVPSAKILDHSSHWINHSMEKGKCILEIEPLYIMNTNCSWMIVLTPENTPSGSQLCVLLTR